MVTSAIFIALLGTLNLKPAISAAINYEPIKISVNENFNAPPGQVSREFQSLEPGVVHQGANFYFKPKFTLPSSSVPHHIEALMSLIQHHSCAQGATKEDFENKLMKILKPFINVKETLADIVRDEENNSEIAKPLSILITEEPKPATSELLVIPEAPALPPLSLNDIPSLVKDEFKKEESETKSVPEEPIVIEIEPKPASPELVLIPEAPLLPPLSPNDMRIVEGVKIEEPITVPESIVVDIESKPVTPERLIIPEAPVLPPLSFNDISTFVEEELKKKEQSIKLEEPTGVSQEPSIIEIEPKPVTPDHFVIPEAPVLPPLTFNDISAFVEKEVKKEESTIIEKTKGVSEEPIVIEIEPKPATPELVFVPEAPVLPPLSANDMRIVEEVKFEEPREHLVIPEMPVLPPLSFNDISTFVEEEIKKKEQSIKLEEPIGVSQEPSIIEIEAKPVTPEHFVIPKAPLLPPLSFNDVSAFVEEEVKKKESTIIEETKGVSEEPIVIEIEPKPASPELVLIPEAPLLPPLLPNDMRIVEGVKIEEPITVPESIVVDIESKPVTPEHLIIPEAPVLPPLSFNDISTFVEEELKKKEQSIKLEEPTSVSQEPSIIEIEAKPVTPEHFVVPKAPLLPPLTFNDISAFVEKEVKKEESTIIEKTKGVSEEPIVIEIEPKPATPELVFVPEAPVLPPLSANDMRIVEEVKFEEPREHLVIPEVPVLPPLSFNDVSTFVEEEIKKKEQSIKLEEPIGVSQEPSIIEIEAKPVTPEHFVIPKAPLLPPLSFNDVSAFVEEEVKKEESTIIEETKGVSEKPIVIEIEPKSASPELVFIPEAPVLPPLSANDIRIVEEVKFEEPEEHLVIPEAPVLPLLSFNNISTSVKEEIKKKEQSIKLDEPIGVSQAPSTIENEPKPEFVAIPEPPVLPLLSFNGIPSVMEDEVKKEESVLLKESTGVFPSNSDDVARPETVIVKVEPKPAIQPEAPVLPPRSDVSAIEEVKSEESIISGELTGRIPETGTETAKSFALEDNIFPVTTEELKIEIPILLEESIEVFPPIAEISSRPTLQESKISNSYVLEKKSQPNSERIVKETLPPTIIQKPSNNLGLFSYAPFLSHLSNRATKTKQVMFPKPASLERFLLRKHPLRLPVTPFPKLPQKDIKSSFLEYTNQFLYPTSYAHDVVEKRIAPNMAFKNV